MTMVLVLQSMRAALQVGWYFPRLCLPSLRGFRRIAVLAVLRDVVPARSRAITHYGRARPRSRPMATRRAVARWARRSGRIAPARVRR